MLILIITLTWVIVLCGNMIRKTNLAYKLISFISAFLLLFLCLNYVGITYIAYSVLLWYAGGVSALFLIFLYLSSMQVFENFGKQVKKVIKSRITKINTFYSTISFYILSIICTYPITLIAFLVYALKYRKDNIQALFFTNNLSTEKAIGFESGEHSNPTPIDLSVQLTEKLDSFGHKYDPTGGFGSD